MRTATAKELRSKTSAILNEVRKGGEVLITFRGKPAAVLKPLANKQRCFRRTGFGLWRDRGDMKDPSEWVEKRRGERGRSTDTF